MPLDWKIASIGDIEMTRREANGLISPCIKLTKYVVCRMHQGIQVVRG